MKAVAQSAHETIEIERCSKCHLPSNYPLIEFNKQGICNFCVSHSETVVQPAESELAKVIASAEPNSEGVHCVVGASGGRDSSYVLYDLVTNQGVKVVAYCADNGYMPEEAVRNLHKISAKLDVKLVVERHNLLTACIGHNLRAWLQCPSPAMIPMICCGCRLGMYRGLLRYAERNHIPLVVLGSGSPVESCFFKRAFFMANPLGQLIAKHEGASMLLGGVYELLKNPRFLMSSAAFTTYAQEYAYFFNLEKTIKWLYPMQRVIQFFKYVEWNENKIVTTIKQKLGWQHSEDMASSWRSDCVISVLKNYLLKAIAGFTEKDEILANMTRAKMITTQEAEQRAIAENVYHERSFRSVLEEAGIKSAYFSNMVHKASRAHQRADTQKNNNKQLKHFPVENT